MNIDSIDNFGIIERIKKFIDYKAITVNKFEVNSGIARGYIAKLKGSVGSDKLNGIMIAYPELNIDWLITGKGDMLKPSPLQNGRTDMNTSYIGTFTKPIVTDIKNVVGSGNIIGGTIPSKDITSSSTAQKKEIGNTSDADMIQLRYENERLRANNEILKAKLELKEAIIENKNLIIEEKERMIIFLKEKK